MKHLRRGCITVEVKPNLVVTYRLALPIKSYDLDLFDRHEVNTYQRQSKSGKWTSYYQFVKESTDRVEILKAMTIAQIQINNNRIEQLEAKKHDLAQQFKNI